MRLPLFLAATSFAAAQSLPPGGFICAPFGAGGTWNLYQASESPLSWIKAQELAAAAKDPKTGSGKCGHLVTAGSAAENMFVYQVVEGWYVWLGLSDSEKFGGREAGANREGGWAWVTGEPIGSFTAPWLGTEPKAGPDNEADAVAIEYGGHWSTWPAGDGRGSVSHPFLIEWDTQLAAPIEGIPAFGRVLPEKWPADLLDKAASRTGSGAWTMCALPDLNGHNLRANVAGFTAAFTAATPRYGMERLNFRMKNTATPAGGWIGGFDEPAHPLVENGCGALHTATVHVETAGSWSFNIHADDFFAARFPGLKWKRVHGLAGTDPLDAETMYYDCESGDGHGIGIIELPAGDHRMEVYLGNRTRGSLLQVLAAPGEFTTDGATDTWRFPGHKAAKEPLAWPGLAADGWNVTRALLPERERALRSLNGAFALVQNVDAFTLGGVARLHFYDTGAPGDLLFPGAAPFPADTPGAQENYAVMATARLVIPRDGVYHFGILSGAHSALCIGGQKFREHLRSTGGSGRMNGDTIYEGVPTRLGSNACNAASIELKKGDYPIEVLYAGTTGPGVCSVFGGPAGYPPRLLESGGAKLEPDISGLPLVEVK